MFSRKPDSLLRFFHGGMPPCGENPSIVAQSVRQALSGSLATLVDLSSFQAALWIDINIFLAAFFSFCLALLTNFFVSRNYVYGNVTDYKYSRTKQFFLYIFAAFLSLGIIQIFLLIFAVYLMTPPLLAKILALPPVFIFTLLSGRFLIFRTRQNDDTETNANG
jgi:putative flippase GtrA